MQSPEIRRDELNEYIDIVRDKRAILDLLGGDIKVHSNINQGSTFVFSFPVHILDRHPVASNIPEYENISN